MKKWVTVPTQTGNIQTKYQTLIKHGCTFSIEKFNTSNNSDHDRHRYKISQHHSTDVTSRWVCKQASINSAKKWENEGKRAIHRCKSFTEQNQNRVQNFTNFKSIIVFTDCN